MKRASLVLILAGLMSASAAVADVTIGNGFTCSGTSILKGSKEVSVTKAKSTIAQTIAKLKQKIKTASKTKKPGLKMQLAQANMSKTLITSCSKGQLDSTQVDQIFKDLSSGNGTYSGSYSGTVNTFLGTIPLSGTVDMTFALNGTVFSATLSLGGNLGSALNAKPLNFQGDVGGIAFPAQFQITGTFIGDVTLSISQTGHVTITNSNSQNASATFDGQFSNSSIAATLDGSYSGNTFSGSANLTHQ